MAKTQSTTSSNSNGPARADLDSATSDVAEQLSVLKADFASLAAAVQDLTGAGAAAAKDEAKARVQAANQAGEAAAQQALQRANAGAGALANYAREKPMIALAAAAGAGLLLGMLTAPRK